MKKPFLTEPISITVKALPEGDNCAIEVESACADPVVVATLLCQALWSVMEAATIKKQQDANAIATA